VIGRGPTTFYNRFVKRWFDIAVSGTALLTLSPVLAAVSLAVVRKHGRPILFRQKRTGLNGKPFHIVKFRTMTDDQDKKGLPDKMRVTALGKWLRETSLDELPELWNVLRGEMSLVGPRPLLHKYMARYSERQQHRHDVRPGLTGWVAVNGRNTTTWEERFDMDLYYVENVGPLLDAKILWRTIGTVLNRKGVDPGFAEQMPEFGAQQPTTN
jgi:lipopolysaccharide/colanic/teichoic acid biosynthesis glycosyltransferase